MKKRATGNEMKLREGIPAPQSTILTLMKIFKKLSLNQVDFIIKVS